jgi:hypothetical protein
MDPGYRCCASGLLDDCGACDGGGTSCGIAGGMKMGSGGGADAASVTSFMAAALGLDPTRVQVSGVPATSGRRLQQQQQRRRQRGSGRSDARRLLLQQAANCSQDLSSQGGGSGGGVGGELAVTFSLNPVPLGGTAGSAAAGEVLRGLF